MKIIRSVCDDRSWIEFVITHKQYGFYFRIRRKSGFMPYQWKNLKESCGLIGTWIIIDFTDEVTEI